jgi:hypothetical protein
MNTDILPKLSIIGLRRTGTTCLLSTLRASLKLSSLKNFFRSSRDYPGYPIGKYIKSLGLAEVAGEPFAGMYELSLKYTPSEIDSLTHAILNVPIIKHIHTHDDVSPYRDGISAHDRYTRCCDIIDTRDIVILTTRKNILEWVISSHLSKVSNAFADGRGYYKTGVTLEREIFDSNVRDHYEWHHVLLPRLIEYLESSGKPYKVMDYETDTLNETCRFSGLCDIYPPLGLSVMDIKTPILKQKILPNEEHISNYDEMKEWCRYRTIDYDPSNQIT